MSGLVVNGSAGSEVLQRVLNVPALAGPLVGKGMAVYFYLPARPGLRVHVQITRC
jgi:hypothetical protein